jgi:hypothetical protein
VRKRFPDHVHTGYMDVVIQIRKEGFLITMSNNVELFFPHRRDISVYRDLCLVFPGADDMGAAETVTFHKIWWGHSDPRPHQLIHKQ